MARFRWGILGTGAVSAKFVAGLAHAQDAEATFVASRSIDKARAFAAGSGIAQARQGYAAAIAEGGVDAVYIATPPSEHTDHALLCIAAGLPVLVEKPFAATAPDAARIADAARLNGVFAMEAMWTRFLPAAKEMKRRVAAGDIGDPRLLSGNFGLSQVADGATGMFDPKLGGGAMAHLGYYPLSLGQWLFGSPTDVQAMGTIGATGVDESVAFQTRYGNGAIGSFAVSLRAWAPDDFQVFGEAGLIAFRGPIVRPDGLNVLIKAPRAAEAAGFGWRARLRQNGLVHNIAQRAGLSARGRGRRLDLRYAGNGYHYEADEVRACIGGGLVESDVMPLADSIAIAETMDRIRDEIRSNPNHRDTEA